MTVKYYCYGLLHKVYLMLCMMCKYFEKLTPVTVQNNHIKVDDFLEILRFCQWNMLQLWQNSQNEIISKSWCLDPDLILNCLTHPVHWLFVTTDIMWPVNYFKSQIVHKHLKRTLLKSPESLLWIVIFISVNHLVRHNVRSGYNKEQSNNLVLSN